MSGTLDDTYNLNRWMERTKVAAVVGAMDAGTPDLAELVRDLRNEIHAGNGSKVNAIIEPLIEIGLDVINLQQPRALGIDEIGRRFAGRICFESLCDIQRTLPFEGREAIEAEAALLLARWATPEGGFVLSDYGDGEAIGVPLWKKQAMLDAFVNQDPYRR